MAENKTNLLVRASRFLRREPQTAWLLLRMGAWVAIFSLAARRTSMPRAMRLVSTETRRRATLEPNAPAIHLSAREQYLAATLDRLLKLDRLCWTPTCWKRAAVLHRYLALAGRDSRIVFGVRRGDEGELDGHAWLEIEGRPVFETTEPRYTRTFAYPRD